MSVRILNDYDLTSFCMNMQYANTCTYMPLGVIIQHMHIHYARTFESEIRAWQELEKEIDSYPKEESHANTKVIINSHFRSELTVSHKSCTVMYFPSF